MSTGLLMLLTLAFYFLLLLFISRKSSSSHDNNAFFRANRRSPWWMVAFGMIGASISGVSFISVPGWVGATQMTYLQMCAGFFFGYVVVAFLLLPLYYRLQLTSIYTYLGERFGENTHRTGALFFLLSKLTGAAARLYLVVLVLQQFIAEPLGIPYPLTALITLLLIWLYTRRSGVKTIVRTDALQTLCMLLALGGILWAVISRLGLDLHGVLATVSQSPLSRIFAWEGTQSFWRQFFSGIVIVIVMTGLDQDMMQKNLTCKNLREAQKNMCSYGLCFLPVNLIFLVLGVLLFTFCAQQGIAIPEQTDSLLPMLVSNGSLGNIVIFPFTIGIVAAAFSSADSAITALTTSCCIDLIGVERHNWEQTRQECTRKIVHILMSFTFFAAILLFRAINSTNVINAIYVMASYTYGPLLGLYAFGLFTRRGVRDRLVPWVCIASPIICGLLDHYAPLLWDYKFGYELLMLNGLLTFAGLLLCQTHKAAQLSTT